MDCEEQVAALPLAFHVSEYIREEMEARGWNADVLAVRMGFTSQHELEINRLSLDFMLELQDPDMYLGADLARGLGRAFGVSPLLFARIDETWRRAQGKPPRDVDADFRPKEKP